MKKKEGRILAVDDNVDILTAVRLLIKEACGMHPYSFQSGIYS